MSLPGTPYTRSERLLLTLVTLAVIALLALFCAEAWLSPF
jgi:hypothetical protein